MPLKLFVKHLAATVVMLLACILMAHASECERPLRLRYSMVPEGDVRDDLARFRPLLDRLQATLGIPVEVVTPASYGAVVEGLLAGEVNLARLGPSSYLSARKMDSTITPFATFSQQAGAFQQAGPFYQALLIVRAGGPMKRATNLRGQSLALVDPDSTSGSRVPRQDFSALVGAPLEGWFGRVSYAGSHTGAAMAVLEGRAMAAFVSSFQLAKMVREEALRKQDIRILWRSVSLPMDPFVFRGKLCADITEKIRSAFLDSRAPVANELLNGMNAIRFLPIQDSDYQVLDRLQ
jgi:phosphonate transport system substrate-binding protein